MPRRLLCLLLLAACDAGATPDSGPESEAPPEPPAAFLRSDFCSTYPCHPDGNYELVDGSWAWHFDFVPVLFAAGVQVATRGDSMVSATLTFHKRTVMADGRHQVHDQDREVARAFIRSLTGSGCGIEDPLAGPRLAGPEAEVAELPAVQCGEWQVRTGDMAAGNVVQVSPAPAR